LAQDRAMHVSHAGSAGFELLALLEDRGAARCLLWTDPASGLRAVVVLDDLTLGPAAGGTRTRPYGSLVEAMTDAAALARTMTLKCAISGIDAGGGKAVIVDHPGLDRRAAFARFGAFVEELGGLFRTAGDLGTTAEDLAVMATRTSYVRTDENNLSEATARSVSRCIEACAEVAGRPGVHGLRVAVQGCGAIGAAVARVLAAAGAELLVADMDRVRARAVAARTGARVVAPEEILAVDCDVLSPCALGGVLTLEAAEQIRAFAVCGAANNIVATPAAEQRLIERGVLFVPDLIASAGAVVHGICRGLMGIDDPGPRIDALGETARAVLDESRTSGRTPTEIAHARARARIEQARRDRQSKRREQTGPTPGP
jgi:leucine dehydrogenase